MEVKTAGVIGMIFAGLAICLSIVGVICPWEEFSNTTNSIPPVRTHVNVSLWKTCLEKYTEETVTSSDELIVKKVHSLNVCLDNEIYGTTCVRFGAV